MESIIKTLSTHRSKRSLKPVNTSSSYIQGFIRTSSFPTPETAMAAYMKHPLTPHYLFEHLSREGFLVVGADGSVRGMAGGAKNARRAASAAKRDWLETWPDRDKLLQFLGGGKYPLEAIRLQFADKDTKVGFVYWSMIHALKRLIAEGMIVKDASRNYSVVGSLARPEDQMSEREQVEALMADETIGHGQKLSLIRKLNYGSADITEGEVDLFEELAGATLLVKGTKAQYVALVIERLAPKWKHGEANLRKTYEYAWAYKVKDMSTQDEGALYPAERSATEDLT